jgi:hypothetical protein
MLTEEKRKELDAVVQDMINNKESDFNIEYCEGICFGEGCKNKEKCENYLNAKKLEIT